MRRLLLTIAVVGLPTTAIAGDAEDLRDRVLAAAAKDPDTLKKLRVHVLKAKGESKTGPTPVPATYEMYGVWPAKTKMVWVFGGEREQRTGTTLCATDDRGWGAGLRTPPVDMTIEQVNDFRGDAYAIWMTTLLPLTDTANVVTMVEPTTVGGRPALGLKVTRRPRPELTMYFDKETLALRRMTYTTRDAGVMSSREMLFDGHKVFEGIRLPTKQTLIIDRKEAMAWAEMEYSFPATIDAKVFAKP